MAQIPNDVVSQQEEDIEINHHFQEEEQTERKLGSKFLSKDNTSEAGSTLQKVNERINAQTSLEDLFKEIE